MTYIASEWADLVAQADTILAILPVGDARTALTHALWDRDPLQLRHWVSLTVEQAAHFRQLDADLAAAQQRVITRALALGPRSGGA